MNSTSTARTVLFAIALIFATPLCPRLLADNDHNPVAVTGTFEGMITTGGAYNVLSHSARRQIDDIVVPGSIGKYPLKFTRYYNSRSEAASGPMGPGWSHEYLWSASASPRRFQYPNGNEIDNTCFNSVGVSDGWQTLTCNPCVGDFRLADGGTVHFDSSNGFFQARTIKDPYGQTTTLAYYTSGAQAGFLSKVTEPGGRNLQFTYSQVNGQTLLTRVDAYDAPGGNQIDHVVYNYTLKNTGGTIVPTAMCLTSVDYSDGTHANYTYRTDNQPEHPNQPCPCMIKLLPLVSGCDDVRYSGPMRRIAYEYQAPGPHGAILRERYWDGVAGHEGSGLPVSRIDPPAPDPLDQSPDFETTFTEYRGDGPSRTFIYTALHLIRTHNGEPAVCPESFTGPAPQQFLTDYTDFRGKNTHLGYDANWYVNSVRDANNHTISYTRGPKPPTGIGEITQIMYPGNVHVDYGYQAEPGAIGGHYVTSVANELGYTTIYNRNGTNHQVYEIDYPGPDGGNETFSYNGFGQVLNHRLRNGAYERFAYDSRGLLTDKWNPKQNAIPADTDPHIHYDYYTGADNRPGWIDRVKKTTLPANWLGHAAYTTYEYERTFDANGITNLNGGAVAGRGLPTKVGHTDGTYKLFKYDWYGNKAWEDDELRNPTSYTYDDYNRLLTVTDPLNKTTEYTYAPTNGTGTSSYLHTTNSADTVTTPSGIVTKNVYDENFRKESSTAAYGTALAAITSFEYDDVGNLSWITNPRNYKTYNTYDARNRKVTTTEAYGTSLARTTTWHYNAVSNIYQIDRFDTTQETKTYNEMNQVLTDTVPKTSTLNIVTTFDYNPSGTLNWVKDGENRTTYFSYDASDRKTRMTYPDNKMQQWLYDDVGNLESRTTVNNETKAFFYDNRNFLYATWWTPNWDNGIVDWCFFDHDAVGRLTEAENGTHGWNTNIISDVHRSYDAAGHLKQDQQIITGLGTKTFNYPSYDDDGRLTRMYVSGASGYDFTYTYDAMGRLNMVGVTNSGTVCQYGYDAASNEIERDNIRNGVNQLYPRDALDRITNWDLRKGNTTLGHEGYTYDPMNRITIVDWANGFTDAFAYYWDGELKLASLGNLGHLITYNLDKAGNRTSVVDNNVTATYSPVPLMNQYTSAAGSSVGNGSEHEISDYQGVHYTYINDERLKSAATGTATYSMTYDALGRCVKRTLSNGPTTYYAYDGEKPSLEYDANGASVGVTVYGKGIDEVVERIAIGADGQWYTYYLHHNHENSVTHLTDGAGNVIEKYRYDAYGAPTIYSATWGVRSNTIYDNRFLFTGREYAGTYRSTYNNAAFNFYEYRARAYNPTLGRFMSEDPKGFDAGDYNLFRYCHNDPIDNVDPMGLQDTVATYSPRETSLKQAEDRAYNFIMGLMQRQFNSAISAGMAGYSAWSAWSGLSQMMGGVTTAQGPPGQATSRSATAPNLNPAFLHEGKKDVDESGKYADHHGEPTGYNIYERDGTVFSLQAIKTESRGLNQYIEHYAKDPPGANLIGNAHWHMLNSRNPHSGSSFSIDDTTTGRFIPVMHNTSDRQLPYAIYYKGWRWGLNSDGGLTSASPYGN